MDNEQEQALTAVFTMRLDGLAGKLHDPKTSEREILRELVDTFKDYLNARAADGTT